jgi:hypothetical protein
VITCCHKEAPNKYLCLLIQKAPEKLAYFTGLTVATIMNIQNMSKKSQVTNMEHLRRKDNTDNQVMYIYLMSTVTK